MLHLMVLTTEGHNVVRLVRSASATTSDVTSIHWESTANQTPWLMSNTFVFACGHKRIIAVFYLKANMRNTGPEKTIVEPQILAYCKGLGFDLSVVDTSAVYNPMAKRYLRRQASESLPDIIGNYGHLSVWIELKAPGKRSSVNSSAHQRQFLVRKIKQGCFACVTDGVHHFSDLWKRFATKSNIADRAAVLMADLPVERINRLIPDRR